MIKAIIFDLDNTLYDYDSCNAIAEKKLFKEISLDFEIPEEKIPELYQCVKNHVKMAIGNEVAASHNRLLYMQDICEKLGRNPLLYAMKFYDVYWNAMLDNMKLFDYVEPLIEEARKRGIKIGILTDLTAHIQYRKIIKLGLAEKIDYLVTSEEAGVEKPSEKIFLKMLGKMRVEPYEALMIGDSYEKDILGAKKVGMEVLHYDRKTRMMEEVGRILG